MGHQKGAASVLSADEDLEFRLEVGKAIVGDFHLKLNFVHIL